MKTIAILKRSLYALGIAGCSMLSVTAWAQPHLVKDINTGAQGSDPMNATDFLNTFMFFDADDGTHGVELWKTDGTAANTVMVKDITAGANGSDIGSIKEAGGIVFFTASDGTNGKELWKTDGTEAGTVMIKDIFTGTASSSPDRFIDFGNILLFRADNGTTGPELWKSDGTAAGTELVMDIRPGSQNSDVRSFSNANGKIFFTADDGTHGVELWTTDGTTAGTEMVIDLNPGSANAFSGGNNFVFAYNGSYYFWADNGITGNELWKTDGTAAGTSLVKDIVPGLVGSNNTLAFIVEYNGMMYFAANNITAGYELWKSDGTDAGTVMVKDINPGMGNGFIGGLPAIINNKLYFAADDGANGTEIWETDGTTTVLFKETIPGAGSGILFPFFVSPPGSNKFYFPANTPANGNEIWVSDGTVGGTGLAADVNPGAGSGLVGVNITYGIGTSYFFIGNDGVTGDEVWALDPVTNSVKGIAANRGNVKLYPNPASNQLTIELNNHDDATADIYTTMGQLIQSLPVQGKATVQTNSFACGTYMIIIKSDNGVSMHKFVKE